MVKHQQLHVYKYSSVEHVPCACSICVELHVARTRDESSVLTTFYLHIVRGYAHEQKAHGGWCRYRRAWPIKHSICDTRGPCQTIRSTIKRVFLQFWQICMLCLRIAQMPRSPDLAIFVVTDRQSDRTDCFTPCACARGNNIIQIHRHTRITTCAYKNTIWCNRLIIEAAYVQACMPISAETRSTHEI
jgi:hypothetical protein